MNAPLKPLHGPAKVLDLRPKPEGFIPCSVEAEQCLLGALLCEADAVFAVSELQPSHFFEPFHQRLFEAIRESALQGRACGPALLASRFANDDALNDLGGSPYLGLLVDRAPPAANAPDYAREITTTHIRRELMRVGQEIAQLGRESLDTCADDLVAEAERLVTATNSMTGAGEQFVTGGVIVKDALAFARARTGRIEFTFGVDALDAFTGGLNAGEATILAARPGMGKTVGAQTVARANAGAGLGVPFFSLEMSASALGLRLASDVAYDRQAVRWSGNSTNPTADRAMKGELSADQWHRMDEAQAVVERWPLKVDTRAGLTLAQIEAAARRAYRKWAKQGIKPGPLIIDHLGKVKPTVDRKGNKHAEMADLSGGVSEMAKRLGVPVLALVQLNRGVEGRDDKRPLLSDLRQAGELEEDARQVLMLYRPEYYLREPLGEEAYEAELHRREELRKVENQLFWLVEKNSHGPRGQVKTFCDIASSAIRDWEA